MRSTSPTDQPDITQFDMTGPCEAFIKFPGAKVYLVWTAGGGMQNHPTTTFVDSPRLDFISCRADPA